MQKVYKKNDIIELEIVDYSHEGLGIGKTDAFIWFIKDAVIGDKIRANIMKVKKNYGYARLLDILEPSFDRIESPCKVSKACGGCSLQNIKYEAELRFKKNKVLNNLIRLGGFKEEDFIFDILNKENTNENKIVFEDIIGMKEPFRYRNKAIFPVGVNKNGEVITGFYATHSHNIIENDDCLIGVEENKYILDKVKEFITENNISVYNEERKKGLVRHIFIRKGFLTNEIMLCFIINGDTLPYLNKLIEKFKDYQNIKSIMININKLNTNVLMGDVTKNIYGNDYIYDYIGENKYKISARSFYQVNPAQTKILYDKVLEYAGLSGEEVVWDLYCGIGTISLFLARNARKVYGIEIIDEAIEDARYNAKLNNLDNTEFYVGKAEEVLPRLYEEALLEGSEEAYKRVHPDVVVVDPPRKGCDIETLDTMLKMGSKKIVYVSCDSTTLARDLKYLCGNGYRLLRVQVVDQFPRGVHVETVVLMSRVK